MKKKVVYYEKIIIIKKKRTMCHNWAPLITVDYPDRPFLVGSVSLPPEREPQTR